MYVLSGSSLKHRFFLSLANSTKPINLWLTPSPWIKIIVFSISEEMQKSEITYKFLLRNKFNLSFTSITRFCDKNTHKLSFNLRKKFNVQKLKEWLLSFPSPKFNSEKIYTQILDMKSYSSFMRNLSLTSDIFRSPVRPLHWKN